MGTIRPLRLCLRIGCGVILSGILNLLDTIPKLNALDYLGEVGFKVALLAFFLGGHNLRLDYGEGRFAAQECLGFVQV